MKNAATGLAPVAILFLILAIPARTQEPGVRIPDDVLQRILGAKGESQTYLVLMAADPVVSYGGGTPGSLATKPAKGDKVDPESDEVEAYVASLKQTHDAALAAVGARADAKVYDYTFSLSGFSAKLTASQARALAAQPGVLAVVPDEVRQLQTDNTPAFLGLSGDDGPWEEGFLGEDVIVGVDDTGIWPEHPSFADIAYGPPPPDWFGTGCDFGNIAFNIDDEPFTCTNKLLAAKSFRAGYLAAIGGPQNLVPGSYLSARDDDYGGHGTLVASTAAGNAGVAASILGNRLGTVSGIAPRARLSIYKACWRHPVVGRSVRHCVLSDVLAALDAAVADGVDVLVYSSSGLTGSSLLGPENFALRSAAAAGVFVVTPAGNLGFAGGFNNPAPTPWVTTVGASTHDRVFQGSVMLGDGSEFFGASVTGGTSALPLVDSVTAGSEPCLPGSLDPAVVSGKIVLCRQVFGPEVLMSQAVQRAGGAGMILYAPFPGRPQTAANHSVPSVRVSRPDGLAIKAYIAATATPTATIRNTGAVTGTQGSVMATFSSRGPNGTMPDLIKPDVTAPGVNILAGKPPTTLLGGAPGQLFETVSGTSFAAPHVAGLAALLKQAHPDWGPAMIKSVLMTTARQDVTKEDGATPADPFDMGAGHVDFAGEPEEGSPFDPGLVYDVGADAYLQFLCGVGDPVGLPAWECALSGIRPIDPSDLNLPSIGVAELVGSQTVTRTVTNVAGEEIEVAVSTDAPPGFTVTVSPPRLALKRRRSATYAVTITNDGTAGRRQWAFGSLTWRGDGYRVYSPIAVRAGDIKVPGELSGTGASGSLRFDVTFGYNGSYATTGHGLVPPERQSGTVVDDPVNNINAALACWFDTGGDLERPGDPACGLSLHLVHVPEDAHFIRFSLFDASTDGNDDLDLYVFCPVFFFCGASGTPTSEEEVVPSVRDRGTYSVFVHGWETDGPDANYTLSSWVVGPNQGNMTVSGPTAATVGGTGRIEVIWSGLDPGSTYLGVVSHGEPVDTPVGPETRSLAETLIEVDS